MEIYICRLCNAMVQRGLECWCRRPSVIEATRARNLEALGAAVAPTRVTIPDQTPEQRADRTIGPVTVTVDVRPAGDGR